MCGRYTAAKDFNELIKLVGIVMARVPFFAPRYNITPTQLAPVIYIEQHQPAMKLNSLKMDDPRCIEPVNIDRDLFERQWWGDA
jgi:putative SOS response-associated peptidase YedK